MGKDYAMTTNMLQRVYCTRGRTIDRNQLRLTILNDDLIIPNGANKLIVRFTGA